METSPEPGARSADDPHAAIMSLLREFWPRAPDLGPDDDIFELTGIAGDDAFEFMQSYAARFGVDVSNYLWYFHHGEEGLNYGALFFDPPHLRVDRIPITLAMLVQGIHGKRWPVQYPDHHLPKVRWDVWLQLPAMLFVLGLAILVATIVLQFLHRNFD
jgi:hypothetical protein